MQLLYQFVTGRDNTCRKRSAGEQFEPDFLTPAVKNRFSAAQDDWTNRQEEFVNQAELKQRLCRPRAAKDDEILA
ncbi:hypothetical protein D3C87_2061170 [compost metagenome]